MAGKALADQGNDHLLGLEVAFRHRVDDPFHGDLMGLVVILAQHRARGQGRAASYLDHFFQHFFIYFH